MFNLKTIALVLVGLAATFNAHALVATSETLTFTRDGTTALPIPSSGNFTNRLNLPSIGVSKTFTIPTWASTDEPGRSGTAALVVKGGNVLVCVSSATANRCANPQADLTQDITDGTAYDFNQFQIFLEPLGGTRASSITIVTPDVSGTTVWAKFYRSK